MLHKMKLQENPFERIKNLEGSKEENNDNNTTNNSNSNNNSINGQIEALRELKKLVDEVILTQAELKKRKNKYYNRNI